jgi:hypothetical protein
MSGGAFDYMNLRLRDIVLTIDDVVEKSKSGVKDEYGFCPRYSKETLKELSRISQECKLLYHTLHIADYLLSDDTSEDTFIDEIKKHRKNKKVLSVI